ncbi:uncharacterized protein BO80DRAFT_424298 [Aspergillus ibericus CBS 121593]|uniref:Hydrophobin n=1 Tax=Aspergillus ibericus CBS 121593 TaxID=1448316 RepID=A0A395H201_9EURO|nr:hypothetical protein BO80DRAFT_424298 [Aspergillus ibericus CBS 121593]RAL01922.1 hypothetical protein BO80DRAFT_424298 [Aspergillus ibericus CBS 121593]
MHHSILSIPLLLTTLTLTPFTTAIPLSNTDTPSPSNTNSNSNTNTNTAPTPSSTLTTPEALESAISKIIVQETLADYSNNTCPPSHRSKQCCESIDNIADQVTGGLGELVPWIEGIEVSSVLGLDCYAMADSTPNSQCLHQVMCCDGKPSDTDQPTTQSSQAVTSSCESWDIAMKNKQQAIDESMAREAAMMDAASSFSAAAVAAATPVGVASGSGSTAASASASASSGVLERRWR